MTSTAPDIGRNYPSAGAIIGPAWEKTWKALSDGAWNTVDEIMTVPDIGARPKTIHGLLGKAHAKGMLERRYVKIGSRQKVQFRRNMSSPAGE